MTLVPYRWYEIEVPSTPDEVARKLQAWTQPAIGEGTFAGKITQERIHITRRIAYRNSFVPFLLGSVSLSPAGSRLRFRFGLHPLSLLVMLALVPFALWFAYNFGEIGPWVPALMVALPLVAAVGTFYWEAPKLLRKVADCLELEPGALEVAGRP